MRNRLQAGSYLWRGAVAVGGLSGRRFLGGEEHGAELGGGAGELGVDPMRAARGCVGGVGGWQREREAFEGREERIELLRGERGAVEGLREGGEGLVGEGGEARELGRGERGVGGEVQRKDSEGAGEALVGVGEGRGVFEAGALVVRVAVEALEGGEGGAVGGFGAAFGGGGLGIVGAAGGEAHEKQAEVVAVGTERGGEDGWQAVTFPDGPEIGGGEESEGAAGEGGGEAFDGEGEGDGAVGFGEEDDEEGNEKNGDGVVAADPVAEEKNRDGGGGGEGGEGEFEPEERAREHATAEGAEHALGGAGAGGAVVGLEDDDDGEGEPVAVREIEGFEDDDAEEHEDAEAERETEERGIDAPREIQRGGEGTQREGVEIEELEGKGGAFVGAVDGGAEGVVDRGEMVAEMAEDFDEVGAGGIAGALREYPRFEDAQEIGEAAEADLGGGEVGGLTGDDGEGDGARGVAESGERGEERGHERGEGGRNEEGLERGVEGVDASGEAGGGEVERFETRAQETGAGVGEGGVSVVERGAEGGLALVDALGAWDGGIGLGGGEGVEEFGDSEPTVGDGATERVLRAEGPVGDLNEDAPESAEEGGERVVADGGVARRGEGDEEDERGGDREAHAVIRAEVAPEAAARGDERSGGEGGGEVT